MWVQVGIVIVMALIEMHVQLRTATEKVVISSVGDVATVDVERFELWNAGKRRQASIGDGDIDQMQTLEGRKRGECFHARVGDVGAAKSELFEAGKLLEMDQCCIGKFGVGQIEDAERLELSKLRKSGIIQATATNAKLLEMRKIG